jgi:tetratricopeptide (TPR) repeat protein
MGWLKQLDQGNWRAAARQLRANAKASRIFARGKVYIRSNERDLGIAAFDEAIRLNPQNAEVFWFRGHSYKEKGQYDRAIADYSEAIRLDPTGDSAGAGRGFYFGSRGSAYHSIGQFDLAISDFNEALRLDSDQVYYLEKRAEAYEAKGDHERAISDQKQISLLIRKAPGGPGTGD